MGYACTKPYARDGHDEGTPMLKSVLGNNRGKEMERKEKISWEHTLGAFKELLFIDRAVRTF